MKASTIERRIEKTVKKFKNPKANKDFAMALKVLVSNGRPIYTVHATGCGKRTKYAGYSPEICLKDWGIDFETGNDAPRGGALGTFIRLTPKGVKQCKEYYNKCEELAVKMAEIEAEIQRKKADIERIQNEEIQSIAGLIEKIDGESFEVTAGRLGVALGERIVDRRVFFKAVKLIRKKCN